MSLKIFLLSKVNWTTTEMQTDSLRQNCNKNLVVTFNLILSSYLDKESINKWRRCCNKKVVSI